MFGVSDSDPDIYPQPNSPHGMHGLLYTSTYVGVHVVCDL